MDKVKVKFKRMDNYLIRDRYVGSSYCGYCNERIISLFFPLILWNKDQIHFIEFHVDCIIKKEKLKEFIGFIEDFDYVYEIN